MRLDPTTLTVVLGMQLVLMALALPIITGWRSSAGVRLGMACIWSQLIGVVLLSVGRLSAVHHVGFVLCAASYPLALLAMRHWLGARPLQRACWLPVALIALLLALSDGDRLLGSVLTHFALALTQLHLGVALLAPAPTAAPASRRWRYLLALPVLVLAGLSLARGLAGLDPNQAFPSINTAHPLALATLLTGNLVTIVASLSVLAAWRGEAETALREAALTDSLTGLANRRALEQRAGVLIADARRHGEPLLALILDIDHFKQVNDEQGHAQGDAALALLGELLRGQQRLGDVAARLGGEEFALLLPRTGPAGGRALDRRLRDRLQRESQQRLGFGLGYSAGWALLRPGDRHVHDLLARADAALYRAKAEGRGRLCAEPGQEADDDPRQPG